MRLASSVTALALLALGARPSAGQRVLVPDDAGDAFLVPRGTARVSLRHSFTGYTERFGATGDAGPLAGAYNSDAFGAANFSALRPLNEDVQTLTGLNVSLGRLETRADALVTTTYLDVEAGVTRWLNLGLTVPYVFTRSEVASSLNASGTTGNVGRNPARFALTDQLKAAALRANQEVLAQLAGAEARLRARSGGCPSGSQSTECRLAEQTAAYQRAVARTYGVTDDGGIAFVPVVGSAAHDSVLARLARLGEDVRSALNESANTITSRPAGATQRLTTTDLTSVAGSGLLGVSGNPFDIVEHGHIGDIAASARVQIFDSFGGDPARRLTPQGFNLRAAVTGTFRLGSSEADTPDDFLDVGTGDGQNDIEVAATADALFGSRGWVTVSGRYTRQLADRLTRRITDGPDQAFPEEFREQLVDRDLGDVFEMAIAPRYALTDFVGVSGLYALRRKGADSYRGTFEVEAGSGSGTVLTLDAATLGEGTEQTEHRLGATVTFSTLSAYRRRRASLPLEISYSHLRAVRGEGYVPRATSDRLQLRVYTGILGGRPPR